MSLLIVSFTRVHRLKCVPRYFTYKLPTRNKTNKTNDKDSSGLILLHFETERKSLHTLGIKPKKDY